MNPIRCILACMLLGVAAGARAELYCVSTPTQLINAIAAAEGGGGSQIRVRTGSYALTATSGTPALSIADNSDLIISGGWNAGCTAQTAGSPDSTILTAQGTGQLLDIEFPNGSGHELNFSMLSFRGGTNSSPIGGGCIYALSLDSVAARLRFELVSFRGCANTGSSGSAALRVDLEGVLFTLVSSVVSGNILEGGNAIFLRGLGGGTYSVTNNTIAFNPSTAGAAGLFLAGASTDFFRLTNNILHAGSSGDAPFGLFAEGSVLGLLNNNHLGGTNAFPAGMTQNAGVGGDPGFVPGSLHLRADSPARDSGLNAAPGGLSTLDYSRNPRILGAVVDRGAYEFDGYFANGFE